MDPLATPPADAARGDGPFPRGALAIVAGLGALLAALATAQAWTFLQNGFPLTAAALALTTAPLVALLVAMGVAPAATDRALARVTRATLRDGGHVFALVVLAVTFWVVFGFGSAVDGANAYESLQREPERSPFENVSEPALLAGLTLNFFVFVAPVAIWLTFVLDRRASDVPGEVGFRSARAGFAIGAGLLLAVVTIGVISVLALAAEQAGVHIPENELALEIARNLSVPAAVAVAVMSGLTEEIFFRGFLQPRIGLLAQGVLFSLAHLSYVNGLEIVVTLTLGIGFGLLYRWTRNLWAPVAAHFGFNLIMLLAGRLADV